MSPWRMSGLAGVLGRILALVFIEQVLISQLSCPTKAVQRIDELPDRSYVKLGDINLGAFFAITEYSKDLLCSNVMRFPLLQQYVEAVVYAINEINQNPHLLPNISLGYVILDDCVKQSSATAQGIRFLPRVQEQVDCGEDNGDNCETIASQYEKADHYDVVGVIGPLRSESSIAVSLLLGPVKIPQISFLSTSDELTNKEIHPYFLRVIPPDEHQVEAIMTFVLSQGWTYISVLYSDGSYGEHAYSHIKSLASKRGVCIATQYKIEEAVEKDYTGSVENLLRFPRARVVMAFLEGADMVGVFTAVHRMKVSRMFIWVGSDGWAEKLTLLHDNYKEALFGSFTTLFYAPAVQKFSEYFRQIKPSTTSNPWFTEFWERQFNCSFMRGTCDESVNIETSHGFHYLALIGSAMDTVYTYAYAIQQLLQDECPGATGRAARECIRGDDLLVYLKNVSFDGYSAHVRFDKNGNMAGKYVINQILPGDPVKQIPVKVIDTVGNKTITTLNNITWTFVAPPRSPFPAGAILPPFPVPVEDKDTPVSVCSRVCGIGEYKIPKDQPCCWDCAHCRDNEIVVANQTGCLPCPIFLWPERSSNLTTCKQIVPDYPIFTDAVVIFETCTSCLGIAAALAVLMAYVYYRDARVIKAASKELSFLQLFAIGVGYITMLVYVAPPTHEMCAIAYWLFCFSFDLLYAPLLVKAVRIYRIFSAAAKGTRGLKLVSPFSQVVISCIIVMGQVLISILVTGLEKPTAILTQPVRLEAFVELSCDITLPGLASFLGYNLTLVILCSVFAFKTRSLPDNFNESRFMSMCVATTLVIWLAFIPTFLTSSRRYLKTLLLTLALLLNHSVALVFLFVSKLYAVICLENTLDDQESVGQSNGALRMRSRNSQLGSSLSNVYIHPVTSSSSNAILHPGISISSNVNIRPGSSGLSNINMHQEASSIHA